MAGAYVSAVNLSEVVAKLIDHGISEADTLAILGSLELAIVPFDQGAAQVAGFLRAATRGLGLSLGDRACLALGLLEKRAVLTADKAWTGIIEGLEIVQIR